jgi:hypothetical protein
MKPTKVTVSRGCTVNLGNFESKRADFTIEVELEPGEVAWVVMDDLMLALRKKVTDFVGDSPIDLPF